MKLLFTGSHHDYEKNLGPVTAVLDTLYMGRPFDIVVEGGALGVDTIVARWARSKGIEVREYKADWASFGSRAGSIRNQDMIDYEHSHVRCGLGGAKHSPCDGPIDLGVAFPDIERSVGTWDMVDRLAKAGIPHEIYRL